MTVRQMIGACVLLLLISAPARSQPPAGSFEQLLADGAISLNQPVHVTDAWGYRIKGRLVDLRPGSLVLMQGSQRMELREAEVNRIQRGDTVLDGLLLGLGGGVAAAAFAPHLFCDMPDPECAAIVYLAIGLPAIAGGTVAGALIDAAVKKTVFRFAGAQGTVRIHVSPVLDGRRAGALATIRF